MVSCPACDTPTATGFRYCPSCGIDLELPDSPTGTAPRPGRDASGAAPPRSPSSASGSTSRTDLRRAAGGDRFVPGTVLAERYRIVGLLGRGGMGEVYRADDLKLEQPVALKFLPRALAGDRERLERLYGEVRMARQVSHPAVCRVWDVGEAEGHHFLSMEFVDGENLASLLRRIGRFPKDKATDVARQIAEGLAAAHAKGVLHRDLKPANVMLDGQGHVRITDFGLASLAESLAGPDVRSGTPAYMSPEQLLGREVSVRSDIYALGLVIYELVTGRRAFEGKGMAELARKHRDERPLEPSAIVPDLAPAVERTILACLEKEPRQRPPSALAVAAMLAGRDPLEAAIAAGDTPSPELVAAAGQAEGLGARAGRICLAVCLAGVLALPALQSSRHLLARIPVEKSPAALEDRARDLLSRVAPGESAADSEHGIDYDADYVRFEQRREAATHFESLASGEPPIVRYWYRESPRPLAPRALAHLVDWDDPPAQITGMAGVLYDLRGRLLAFYSVPPQLEREPAGTLAEPDWAPLFAEARLDPAALRRVDPVWTPPFHSDARAAWEEPRPSRPELALRVEAAAHRGRPVWFELKRPWTRPERQEQAPRSAREGRVQSLYILILVTLVAAGGALAWRNLALGRGDRRGAFRLAATLAGLGICAFTLRAHHVARQHTELYAAAKGCGLAVLVAALVWLFYLALEPYVRRLRPWTLVSWSRLLHGGLRDAVVGRDVLIGLTFGICLALVSLALRTWPGRAPELFGVETLLSTRVLLSYLVGMPVNATLSGLSLLLLFLILRLLTRRDWIAAALVVAFLAAGDLAESRGRVELWLLLPLAAAAWGLFVALLLRYGVLAAITAVFAANVLGLPPLLYAPGHWTGAVTVIVVPAVVGLAVLAFRSATSGRRGRLRFPGHDPLTSRPS
jgi:serine/threonine-protein kinase